MSWARPYHLVLGPFVLIVALMATTAVAQEPGEAVTFLFPPHGSYVSGPIQIRVGVSPTGLAVQRLTVYADGRVVCSFERGPYACDWDAGPLVEAHALRAVAQLTDGRRVVSTITTKSGGYVESVAVDAVQLAVTVTDSDGQFVRNLPQGQFRVYEDDVLKRLTTFMSENVPLEVVVALDVSGSMKEAIDKEKAAARAFLSALRPTDQVTLIGFNDSVFTLSRPTATAEQRDEAVDRLTAWGGTALYDVLVRSLDQVGRRQGRRALVIFTDGEDTTSRLSLADAERRVEASDAVLFLIGMGRGTEMKNLRLVLERLANISGGKPYFIDRIEGLATAFQHIVDELANQYLLGYIPPDHPDNERWHRVRVEVTNRAYRVRARQGYRRLGAVRR